MVGPVLAQELLLGSRRSRQQIFRRIFTGWLMAQLLFFYFLYLINANVIGHQMLGARLNIHATTEFATSFASTLIYQQLILLLLATPAFTAGAITDEKASGTLQYLLAADLTSGEIILGKLLGRVAQVTVLALATLPVLCFIGIFGGLNLVLVRGSSTCRSGARISCTGCAARPRSPPTPTCTVSTTSSPPTPGCARRGRRRATPRATSSSRCASAQATASWAAACWFLRLHGEALAQFALC